MDVVRACKSYFNGFSEISRFNKNDSKTNALAILKLISYISIIIPLGFAATLGVASLVGRVNKKSNLTSSDQSVSHQANKTLSASVSKITSKTTSKADLNDVLSVYDPRFLPKKNAKNLREYYNSADFARHATSARIYYNSGQLHGNDALRIVSQREPTNIAMGSNQYNKEKLKEQFGYEKGVFNDSSAVKKDGSSYKDMPNTAAVYSETYLWNPPGGKNKAEIAVLSLPAPALDSKKQPHFNYYMNSGQLDAQRYDQEMEFLFKTIERAIRDNKDTAFNQKGIKRVVLSKFGQGAFLGALPQSDRIAANEAYKKQLAKFLDNVQDLHLDIVMSEYTDPGDDLWHQDIIVGDIIETAQDGDFIVNAWDPHSAPGNGNDADHSFDGAMGRGTAILLSQTSWLNEHLKNKDALVPVS